MTREQAKLMVAALKAAFPRQAIEQETLDVYAQMMVDLPVTDGQAAVEKLLKQSRFFPSIAEIREAVLDLNLPLPSPAEAWGLVEEAGQVAIHESRSGSIEGVMQRELPPVVWRALRVVGGEEGWRYSQNVNALRSQFLRVYADLRDGAVAGGEKSRRSALERSEQPALGSGPVALPALRSLEP